MKGSKKKSQKNYREFLNNATSSPTPPEMLPIPQRSGKSIHLTPLEMCSSLNDTIVAGYIGLDPNKKEKVVEFERWKNKTNHVDLEYGMDGTLQESFNGTSLRRYISNPIFNTQKSTDVSLQELHHLAPSKIKKNFVLVDETRLTELTKFENTLRMERDYIGDNANPSWVLSDIKITPHIPTQATRMAIQNLCEVEMKKLNSEIINLQYNWDIFSRKNHYNKPHLFLNPKESYFNNAPVEQRAMKIKLVREAAETWRLRKDRDSMLYEDDYSYIMGKYKNAKARRQDYDRYFVLATRYGHFSESKYKLDPFPGKRYWIQCQRACVLFQKKWDQYWSVAKLRRYRAARYIQKMWRGKVKYKELHALIIIRMRFGKRTYFFYCWSMWISYNLICRRIKERIAQAVIDKSNRCYFKWKKDFLAEKAERKRILDNFIKNFKEKYIALCFNSWKKYSKNCKLIIRKVRRFMQNPHLDMWITYTINCRNKRITEMPFTMLQSFIRKFIERKRYLRKLAALYRLRTWWKVFYKVHIRRKADIAKEYKLWKPEEIERRIVTKDENEKRRQTRQNVISLQKEKKMSLEIRRHIKKSDGKCQLREITFEINNQLEKKLNPNGKKIYNKAAEILQERAKTITKMFEQHDFDSKTGPFMRCPHADCRKIFSSEETFYRHLFKVEHINKVNNNNFNFFVHMLKHSRGQDWIRSFIANKYGVSSELNCLDFWALVQDWKKSHHLSSHYTKKALSLYESFLRPNGTRFIGLAIDDELIKAFEVYKEKEFDGLWKEGKATKGWLRLILHLPQRRYKMFSTDNVVKPDVFDMLESECFFKVYRTIESAKEFPTSYQMISYNKLLAVDAISREKNLFRDYKISRHANYVEWSRLFKIDELEILRIACETTEKILDIKSAAFNELIVVEGVRERQILEMHRQQKPYENHKAAVEDALFWAEDDTLDDIFDRYVRDLINTMLDRPDCRKGLLEYAGMVKLNMNKRLVNKKGKKKENDDWYHESFQKSVEMEKKTLPLEASIAVKRMQARFRSRLARNRMRKLISQQYVKKLHVETGRYYYENVKTLEISWERPALFTRLFPKSTW